MKQDILNSSLHTVTTVGDFKSHKAEIDAEDLGWILQILSTNLYSDPIGSLVREYSSNAWDANIEAGNKDKPIEVGIQTDKDQGSYWYVTDLGPGLSPERIDKIYRKFGKSTKRDSNEAIGMMGLGKFSGLSYSDQIYITTRYDGMQYQYLMHKADSLPQIDLLTVSPSDLPTGTTIKIFIKNWSDRRNFENATDEQLAYFENVFYNIDSDVRANEFKLLKGKTFTYSSKDHRGLRIKLGPVSYPIDWDAIGMNRGDYTSYSGLAINFNIGELAITPNRESLLYNTKTISNIKLKFEMFEREIAALYNTKTEYEDPVEFVTALNNMTVKIGNNTYYITSNMRKYITVTPMLKGFPYKIKVTNADDLFSDYKAAMSISNGKKSSRDEQSDRLPWKFFDILSGNRAPQKLMLLDKHSLEPKHSKYMMEKLNSTEFQGIRKRKTRLFPPKTAAGNYMHSSTPNYYNILDLKSTPKSMWRKKIQAFQEWQENYINNNSNVVKYDDYIPTKEWLKGQKSLNAKPGNDIMALRKAEGKILVKKARASQVWSATAGFDNKDIAIKELPNLRHYVIYGTEESKNILSLLYPVQSMWANVRNNYFSKFETWIVAQVHHKYLKILPNFIHIDDFMKCKDRVSIKFATNALLHRKYADQLYALQKSSQLVKYVNEDAAKRIDTLFTLSNTFLKIRGNMNSDKNKEAFDTMVDTLLINATTSNMWDFNIVSEFTFLDKVIKELMIVKLLKTIHSYTGSDTSYTYSQEIKDFFVESCKLRKVRIDFKHYQPKQENEQSDESTDL